MGKEGGGQSTMDGIRCWKVWAQGFGSGWAGIMRYGAMYWTPLIVFFIMKGGRAATEATPEQVKVSGAPIDPDSAVSCCTGNALNRFS